jgi:predicted nucleic acid-binding protein
MTLVVDASAACKWFIGEPGSDAAEALAADGAVLLAPDLFVRRSATRRLLRLAATPWARLVLKLGVATG